MGRQFVSTELRRRKDRLYKGSLIVLTFDIIMLIIGVRCTPKLVKNLIDSEGLFMSVLM